MNNEGRKIFNRPPRPPHQLPKGLIEIPRPPEPQFRGTRLQWLLVLAPIALAVVTVTVMILVNILRPNSNILFLLTTVTVSMGFVVTGVLGLVDKMARDRANRQDYRALLDERENQLRDFRRQQQTSLRYLYPDLGQIVEWPFLPDPPRLWERRVEDDDFLSIRMGIGSRPSTVEVSNVNTDKKVPLLEEALRVSGDYRNVPDVPDLVELNLVASLGIVGPTQQTSAFVRSILCHLCAHHSPEEVKLLATYSSGRSEDWFWLGWLPHTWAGKGDVPLLASHSDQLAMISNFLIETLKRREIVRYNAGPQPQQAAGPTAAPDKPKKGPYTFPNYVWIIEDFELVQDDPAVKRIFEIGHEFGIYLIITTTNPGLVPERCRAVATIRPNGQVTYEVSGALGRKATLQPDMCDTRWAEQFALSMAPLKLKAAGDKGDLPTSLRMLEMDDWNINASQGEAFDPSVFWNRSSVGTLKAPIGRLFGGQPLYLDISDKGHGPHGLIAGTTGSGKSELLLTIVCALALANSPDNLNFILGDFKGGLAFNPFKNLPHVVGMMSNLDLTIVERAMTALFSELQRRQRLLDKEGVAHIRDYQRKKPRPEIPMPYLLVIIDEFAEMKEQAPDFMDKIINIARLGRTLGVHMVLATQRPAGVVSGQLNSNTNFRLCLRVVASEDSVDMLGRKDAFLIPSDKPGRCFFKVGSDIFEQFQVARVAIPFGPPTDDTEIEKPLVSVIDRHWSMAPLSPQLVPTGKKASEESEIKALDYDVITEQCIKAASRMTLRNKHKPWLDPMKDRYFLPDFLDGKGFDEEQLIWPETPSYGFGVAPLAFLDDVVRQEQRSFYFDLLRDGSYCISGLAQSGKTNLLRSMLATLALTHNPDEMRFVVIDMGGTLRPFSELPHQTRYVGMAHANQLKALFKDLYEELQNRRQTFAEAGVLDITSYRALAKPGEKMPAMFIAFDNFATIRHNPPFDMEQLKALIREGRSYGMHVAITMDKANDFEFGRLAGQFFHIALRQAREDILFPIPKNMVGSWNGIPGRCFIKSEEANKPPLELQILLPCLAEPEDQTKALEDLVDQLRNGAARNSRWANLNGAPAEATPAQKAPAGSPVVTNAPAEADLEKDQDASDNAAMWDDLFKVPAPATPMAPGTQPPTNGATPAEEPAVKNEKAAANASYWDDLFKAPPSVTPAPAPVAKPAEEPAVKSEAKSKAAANASYWDDLFKAPAQPAPPPVAPPAPVEAAKPAPINNNGNSAPENPPAKIEEGPAPNQNGENKSSRNNDEPKKKLRI